MSRILLATATLVLLARPGQTQQLSGFDRGRALIMLDVVREDIEKNYFDPQIGRGNLPAIFDTARARIQRASRVEETLLAIAQATVEVNDGHTFFLSPRLQIRADYGWTMGFVGDTCRILWVAPGSDAALQGVRPGDPVLQVEAMQPSRNNLIYIEYALKALFPRSSVSLTLQGRDGQPVRLKLASVMRERRRFYDLAGGDVADLIRESQNQSDSLRTEYVEIGQTLVAKFKTFAVEPKEAEDLLHRAGRYQALVLDLRDNGGGYEETMRRMLNGLFPDSQDVFTVRGRKETRSVFIKGSGDHAYRGRLVVLLDSRSASAAEAVAKTVQLTGRGRVVGDRSAGSLRRARAFTHTVGTESVVLYGVQVTTADVIPPDGSNLEGVGVTPDEIVLPTGADFVAGRDPALAHALGLVGVQISPEEAGRYGFGP